MMYLQDKFSAPFLDMLHHAANTTPPQTVTAWSAGLWLPVLAWHVFNPGKIPTALDIKNMPTAPLFGVPFAFDDRPLGRVAVYAGQNGVGAFNIDVDFFREHTFAQISGAA